MRAMAAREIPFALANAGRLRQFVVCATYHQVRTAAPTSQLAVDVRRECCFVNGSSCVRRLVFRTARAHIPERRRLTRPPPINGACNRLSAVSPARYFCGRNQLDLLLRHVSLRRPRSAATTASPLSFGRSRSSNPARDAIDAARFLGNVNSQQRSRNAPCILRICPFCTTRLSQSRRVPPQRIFTTIRPALPSKSSRLLDTSDRIPAQTALAAQPTKDQRVTACRRRRTGCLSIGDARRASRRGSGGLTSQVNSQIVLSGGVGARG